MTKDFREIKGPSEILLKLFVRSTHGQQLLCATGSMHRYGQRPEFSGIDYRRVFRNS